MEASNGQEFFISYDDVKKDKICALLRLRFSSYSLNGKKHFIKELEGAALVREVHTYGEQVEISRREKFHQGQVPLSTIKAHIDYAEVPCLTRSGYIGVKVYLCLI
jgi:hypothetical protein